MLDTDDEAAGDIPVLLDFGSMGVARVDIRNISEARALQVVMSVNLSVHMACNFLTLLEPRCH